MKTIYLFIGIDCILNYLHRFCDRIIGCQVVIEAPHQNHHKGKIYHVRINLSIPQENLAINRDSEQDRAHENPYIAIRDAFAAAQCQLKRYADIHKH